MAFEASNRIIKHSVELSNELFSERVPSHDKKNEFVTASPDHKFIRLRNNLRVLLISEPFVENNADEVAKIKAKTLCSMCIDVGAFSDPNNIQGLSHLIELMLPQVEIKSNNEIFRAIDDAYSDRQQTVFAMQTNDPPNLALRRFAEYFINPTMSQANLLHGRRLVDVKFREGSSYESVRRNQILASMFKPGHPALKFSSGNLKTLHEVDDDDKLLFYLHRFIRRHYSAHRMYLCVKSHVSLSSLQNLVTENFQRIWSTNKSRDYSIGFTWKNSLQPKFHNKIFYVKALHDDVRKIDLTWCLEPLVKTFKSKPSVYFDYILRSEGEGSLIKYLRSNDLAEDLKTTVDNDLNSDTIFSLFVITIDLTKKGLKNVEKVLEAVFNYLKYLQKNGINERIFSAIKEIRYSGYLRSKSIDSLDDIIMTSMKMRKFPPGRALDGICLFDYEPKVLQEFIDKLNEMKFNIMITSKQKIKYNTIEPWYGTEYAELDMPADWIKLWKSAKSLDTFVLPGDNPFIASDFTIHTRPGYVSRYPIKIIDTDLCETWIGPDDRIPTAEATYYLYLASPLTLRTPKCSVLRSLMVKVLKHELHEQLNLAKKANISVSIQPKYAGILIFISGISQVVPMVLNVIINRLKSLTGAKVKNDLEMYKDEYFTERENVLLNPYGLNEELKSTILEYHRFNHHELNESLSLITYEDFEEFCNYFRSELYVRALLKGNVTIEIGNNVMENVLDSLDAKKIEDMSSINLISCSLPIGEHYLRCQSYHPTSPNTCVANYYQFGYDSFENHAKLELLVRLATDPLVGVLMYEEQLGYHVSIEMYRIFNIIGYVIRVDSQETRHPADDVELRIEDFRRKMHEKIESIPDKEFLAAKQQLVEEKLAKCNLYEEFKRNLCNIDRSVHDFTRNQQEARHLIELSKYDILKAPIFNNSAPLRKLSIQVIGNKQRVRIVPDVDEMDQENRDGIDPRKRYNTLDMICYGTPNSIRNFKEFKKTLQVHPYVEENPKEQINYFK